MDKHLSLKLHQPPPEVSADRHVQRGSQPSKILVMQGVPHPSCGHPSLAPRPAEKPKWRAPIVPSVAVTGAAVKLSEAVSIYLRLKGKGRPVTFQRAAERSCGYVIDVCGDKDIAAYTKADANAFRDDLLKRGLTGSSITRVFGTVRSVINFAASECGVEFRNPFGKVYYDRNAGVEARVPIPVDVIRKLQQDCRRIDDDLRWLVALVSDTGMRLAEAAGLLKDELRLDDPIRMSSSESTRGGV